VIHLDLKHLSIYRDQDRRGGFYELVSCDSSGSKTSIHIRGVIETVVRIRQCSR